MDLIWLNFQRPPVERHPISNFRESISLKSKNAVGRYFREIHLYPLWPKGEALKHRVAFHVRESSESRGLNYRI
jgi:hypothetical protein